ncbi:MAG: pyrroline-5-carboxylate reductase dimerization domain-containing protein [Planctomycetota bacterium]
MRAAVTSKAGTTAAATGVFDDADLHSVVAEAMRAVRDRGRELGRLGGVREQCRCAEQRLPNDTVGIGRRHPEVGRAACHRLGEVK